MKKLIFILIVMFSISMLAGETYVKPGDVFGCWSSEGSPYIILGNIAIPNDQILRIEAGTRVIFKGYYQLNVYGVLHAVGTKDKMITFQSKESKKGWSGILFSQKESLSVNVKSKLIYCKFMFASAGEEPGDVEHKFSKKNSKKDYGAAIELRGVNNLQISNCLIYSLSPIMWGSGISLYNSSPEITENIIFGNCSYEGAGIYIENKSHPFICNNRIEKNVSFNGAGVCIRYSSPTLVNNLIVSNNAYESGGGMYIENNANPLLINNTIVNNKANQGGAFMCADNSDPAIYNSIIWGNKAELGTQVYLLDKESDPDFRFCDIYKGDAFLHGFGGKGAYHYKGIYEKNLDINPLFDYFNKHSYSLMQKSPCIDNATKKLPVKPPRYDIIGNLRISGKRLDMGAYEYQYITPEDKSLVTYSTPVQFNGNYPNPFNPITNIAYSIKEAGNIIIEVYNLKGQLVKTLVNETKEIGNYTVSWNGTDNANLAVSGGIYFYKIKAKNYTLTKKMILLK